MRKTSQFKMLLVILAVPIIFLASAMKTASTTTIAIKEKSKSQGLVESGQPGKLKFITAVGIDNFVNELKVFAQNSSGEKREYKIKTIAFTKTGDADPNSLNEFQQLVADGYLRSRISFIRAD
jgi:hypothetical protein